MDLTPSEDQQAIIDLATRIVGDHTAPDRLRERERADLTHDDELWSAMVAADLVGLSVPESCGGGGYGLTEAALIAEVVGRHVAPVPFAEVVSTARLLGAAGDEAASRILGGEIVVPALREGVEAAEALRPTVRATSAGEEWTLTGNKRLVIGATDAVAYLVPATTDGELQLFVVSAGDITAHTDSTTSAGQLARSIDLDGTAARRIELPDPLAALESLRHELRILRCAQYAGVADGALQLAAQHCKERQQFGAPIGTFQAVAHRMADAWLDTSLMQATARQAAWRSDHGLPATQAAASASLWACQGGPRVVEAAQHVHGGIGVDLDYPVHRYFRWAKDLELQLGGASASALDLGAAIAAEPLTIG